MTSLSCGVLKVDILVVVVEKESNLQENMGAFVGYMYLSFEHDDVNCVETNIMWQKEPSTCEQNSQSHSVEKTSPPEGTEATDNLCDETTNGQQWVSYLARL